MRRYRKGDIFRPPTAAESAANADALEGFRRRSPESQVRLSRGDKILVKTPEGGIPARVGTTISSAICTKLVETSTAEEKTLLETDEELEVFNLDTGDVPGEVYAQTGLTAHGTRCAEAASPWHWAKLDGALAFDGTATASVWDGAPLADTTDNLTVYPPPVLTSGSIASGTWVRIDLHRNGRWYVIIAECP